MKSIEGRLYEAYLNEAAASSAHIGCSITKGLSGEITVVASGHKAVLFCCVCEILKNLAKNESEDLNMQKQYLALICDEVAAELELESGT